MCAASRHTPAGAGDDPGIGPAEIARATHPPPTEAARTAARRFLLAFLSFEVGAGGRATRRTLRADASAAFAHRLLEAAPGARVAGRDPARLGTLRLHPLSGRPELVLVTGTALRPSGPEPLAFLFGHRRGRWLAVAPAE